MERRDDALKYLELGPTSLLTPPTTGRTTWRLDQLSRPWYLTLSRKHFVMVERAGASVKHDLTASVKKLPGEG